MLKLTERFNRKVLFITLINSSLYIEHTEIQGQYRGVCNMLFYASLMTDHFSEYNQNEKSLN